MGTSQVTMGRDYYFNVYLLVKKKNGDMETKQLDEISGYLPESYWGGDLDSDSKESSVILETRQKKIEKQINDQTRKLLIFKDKWINSFLRDKYEHYIKDTSDIKEIYKIKEIVWLVY